MSRAPFPALVRLAARRVLEPRTLCALAVLGLLATRAAAPALGSPPSALADPAGLARLRLRHAVWVLTLLFLAPVLVARAAAVHRRWREAGRLWLAPRPYPPGLALLAELAGTWLAGALLVGAVGLGAELAAGASGPVLELRRRVEHPPLVALDAGAVARVPLPRVPGAPGARRALGERLLVALRLAPLPGAAAPGEVELAFPPATAGTARLPLAASRVQLVPLPPGARELELRPATDGSGFVLAGSSLALLAEGARERAAGPRLAAAALLAWAAWCATAAALGTRLRPSLAALSCLALWLAPRALGLAPGLAPGGALPERAALLEEGVLPPAPGAGEALGSLALAAVAAAVAVAGRRGGDP